MRPPHPVHSDRSPPDMAWVRSITTILLILFNKMAVQRSALCEHRWGIFIHKQDGCHRCVTIIWPIGCESIQLCVQRHFGLCLLITPLENDHKMNREVPDKYLNVNWSGDVRLPFYRWPVMCVILCFSHLDYRWAIPWMWLILSSTTLSSTSTACRYNSLCSQVVDSGLGWDLSPFPIIYIIKNAPLNIYTL